MTKWYAYLHVNNTIHVKRYFSDWEIEEARESPFVAEVTWLFDAVDFNDAMRQAKEILE